MTKNNTSIKYIIDIVKEIYDKLPDEFNVYDIVAGVKNKENHNHELDSTILRMLSKLREDNHINYKVFHKRKGRYLKIPLNGPAPKLLL